jgi:hypothetical protein
MLCALCCSANGTYQDTVMRRRWWRSWTVLLPLIGLVLVSGTYLAVAIVTREEPNYTRIEDGLYQGGNVESPPWRTRAVLNLCETEDTYTAKVHVWEPIRDASPAPGLDWLRTQVEWIEAQRGAGNRVFVHCRNGVSRSGMVVVAYLMFKNRWPRDQALEYVRSRRPITRPNPTFMELLAEWEKVVLAR